MSEDNKTGPLQTALEALLNEADLPAIEEALDRLYDSRHPSRKEYAEASESVIKNQRALKEMADSARGQLGAQLEELIEADRKTVRAFESGRAEFAKSALSHIEGLRSSAQILQGTGMTDTGLVEIPQEGTPAYTSWRREQVLACVNEGYANRDGRMKIVERVKAVPGLEITPTILANDLQFLRRRGDVALTKPTRGAEYFRPLPGEMHREDAVELALSYGIKLHRTGVIVAEDRRSLYEIIAGAESITRSEMQETLKKRGRELTEATFRHSLEKLVDLGAVVKSPYRGPLTAKYSYSIASQNRKLNRAEAFRDAVRLIMPQAVKPVKRIDIIRMAQAITDIPFSGNQFGNARALMPELQSAGHGYYLWNPPDTHYELIPGDLRESLEAAVKEYAKLGSDTTAQQNPVTFLLEPALDSRINRRTGEIVPPSQAGEGHDTMSSTEMKIFAQRLLSELTDKRGAIESLKCLRDKHGEAQAGITSFQQMLYERVYSPAAADIREHYRQFS